MKPQPNPNRLLTEMERWPKSWVGLPSDLKLGQRLVDAMRPFLVALIADGLAPATVRRHWGNLWLLGGHIVSTGRTDPDLQKLDDRELLLRYVDDESGPPVRHLDTEHDQRQFDSTCRKLHRFLTTHQPQSEERQPSAGIARRGKRPERPV